MASFVVLTHTPGLCSNRPLHWDLMLEDGESLLTWALERELAYDVAILAEQLAPHRTAYLEFEGEISEGRGSVQRWDRGEFRWLQRTTTRVAVEVLGSVLKGRLVLERPNDTTQRWVVSCSPPSPSDGLRTTAF